MEQVYSSVSHPTLKVMLEAYERRLIEEALSATGGNQRGAARALGVLPTTLHEKMKRLGLLHRVPQIRVPGGEIELPVLVA